ncbi:cytochrome c3 family protein [Flexithrix dorotheae]|uniref:cytochrome c3 family protein n=1 Tax=Flexithrix dorotheae TaxID=70993 RepID=UPI000365FBB0|nr:cytochrome c3 family protein [Flexithrix dorotheae]
MSKLFIKLKVNLILYILPLFLASQSFAQEPEIPTDAAVISEGAKLFKGNCAQCHNVKTRLVGPALQNVWERQPVSWVINFIKYPEKTITSGDPYATALYEEYKQMMPNHDFFSDEEILSILAYVKDETNKEDVADVPTPGSGGGGQEVESSVNSDLLLAIVVGLVILLIIILIVMVLLVSALTRYIRKEKELTEEEKEFLDQRFDVGSVLKSKAFIGIVTFIFVAVVAQGIVDGLLGIGVQQGYAPDQPIPFSHKLHAGYYEIDCKYCHTGVEKSKNANIPSANICMNCHNSIRTTSPEMNKIYTAIENNEPIQWVRVHNLPDLAYFNHSQHVKVGGLDCENCHGDIKEMEVVQQHSLLTMGWCIDCHRETDVNAKGNDYYDKLLQLHESDSKEPMKVEDIGGLECSKCHY